MHPLKARVENGRLVLDEPTSLPEGTEVFLTFAGGEDDLDDEERAALHRAIERGLDDVDANRVIDADVVLAELHARSNP
jgi:hypothetical protein